MRSSAATLAYVVELVRRRSGIVLGAEKEYLVDARLIPLARSVGLGSVDELVSRVREDEHGAYAARLVEALTTNETSFFRDGHPFTALSEDFLPALVRARASSRSLHVWSGAASTGQEAYSIAMVLRERFPELAPERGQWSVRILATDLNHAVLERARRGVYASFELGRGLPPSLRARYFHQVDGGFRLDDAVRRMVTFSPLNLHDAWSIPKQDVIFMRNVLMYFDAPQRARIWRRLRTHLRGDGYLIVGSGEHGPPEDDFHARRAGSTTFYVPRSSEEGSQPQ